jgi:leucyl aminopeptidase
MKFSLNSKSSSPPTSSVFIMRNLKNYNLALAQTLRPRPILPPSFKAEEIKASFGEMVFYRNAEEGHGLYVGLGDGKITEENLRELTGKIYKKLAAERVFDVSLSLEALPFKDKVKAIAALTEGFVMSSYSFDTFKKAPKKAAPEMHVHYKSKSTSAAIKNAMAEAEILGEGVNFARWLGDCPGNFMNPTQLATEAKNAAKGTKMKVTIWDKARIAKEKMDSLIGVSNGSDQEPRFIIMEYKGAAASKKPISFVGKGLTFRCWWNQFETFCWHGGDEV